MISQQRPKDTDYIAFAGSVVSQIEKLVAAGVPEDHIAVVGFSKGGAIAMRVSSFLRRPDVRFVLLAACWREDEPQVRFTGRVLSIREKSDKLAGYSCKPIAEKAEKPTSFEEIVIDTGKSHGAFYLPRKEWTKPTLDFIGSAQHAEADADANRRSRFMEGRLPNLVGLLSFVFTVLQASSWPSTSRGAPGVS